jgi:hypothetical protein
MEENDDVKLIEGRCGSFIISTEEMMMITLDQDDEQQCSSDLVRICSKSVCSWMDFQ